MNLPANIVYQKGEDLLTDSRHVANAFNKRHDNIIAKIKGFLANGDDFDLLNFKEISYFDSANRPQKMFEITFDGWVYLVMGFTGKDAEKVKKWYIAAWNKMRNHIINQEKALVPILERLTDISVSNNNAITSVDKRVDQVFGEIEDINGNVNSLNTKVDKLELKLVPPRMQFSAASKRTYGVVHRDGYNGCCPHCGKETEPRNMEIDHFEGRNQNKITQGWIICKDCHKKKTGGKLSKKDMQASFDAFHHMRKLMEKRKPKQRKLWE